jgi:hypothetical protein
VDPVFRARFFDGLNALMRRLEFQVVACAIRKDRHKEQYGGVAIDPYELSLHVLVERFCFERGGVMVAEERDEHLNRELTRAWERLKDRGTTYVPAERVRGAISALKLRPKSANIAGLQVADLVASPIGRYVIGKTSREDWRIIERKFRQRRCGGLRRTWPSRPAKGHEVTGARYAVPGFEEDCTRVIHSLSRGNRTDVRCSLRIRREHAPQSRS